MRRKSRVSLSNIRRGSTVLLLGLSLLLAACGAAGSSGSGSGGGSNSSSGGSQSGDGGGLQGVIKIGAVLPISGPISEWGKTNQITLKMLEKEINDAGGINGARLEMVITDSGAKPDEAANLVRRLAGDDKVLAIVGPLTSSETEVAFKATNREGIVSTSMASSKPGVAEQNRPWAFRNTVDEAEFAAAVVPEFAKRFNVKRPAVIIDAANAVGSSLGKNELPNAFSELGIDVINKDDPVTFQTTDIDLQAQVTKLRSLNPDALIIGAYYNGAVNVVSEMKRQNLNVPIVGGSPLIATAMLEPAPEIPIMAPATYFVGLERGDAADFTKKTQAAIDAAGGLPAGTEPNMYDVNSYEIAMMYIEAIKNAGVTNEPGDLKADREKIRDYLAGLKGFQGIAGQIGFKPTGDAEKDFFVVLGQNEKWTVIE